MKVLYLFQIGFRRVARVVCIPLIWLLMPAKLFAYRIRWFWLRRLILEVTTFFDFAMVFALTQNEAMRLHGTIYRGNFIFGKAVMVTDHETAEREIAQTTLRGNRFMGVDIVSNDPMAFATNAGPITTGQPTRGLIRGHIDREIMTDRVRSFDLTSLRTECAPILAEWSADPAMTNMWIIRGAVTRLFLQILAEQAPPKKQTDEITFHYTRRFVEFSLFGRYLPLMLGILGTREGIRRDAYIPLSQLGIDNMVIDMTLFAAMFSVGTIVMKCVEFAATHNIDYAALPPHARMIFVIEAQRLCPTVTSVHRIIERDEMVTVRGRELRLGAGDEVAYPFLCINRDPRRFERPTEFRLDRSREEYGRVLSWSAGPHVCPAKDLSILATVMMLDALAARGDLRTTPIMNLEF